MLRSSTAEALRVVVRLLNGSVLASHAISQNTSALRLRESVKVEPSLGPF